MGDNSTTSIENEYFLFDDIASKTILSSVFMPHGKHPFRGLDDFAPLYRLIRLRVL